MPRLPPRDLRGRRWWSTNWRSPHSTPNTTKESSCHNGNLIVCFSDLVVTSSHVPISPVRVSDAPQHTRHTCRVENYTILIAVLPSQITVRLHFPTSWQWWPKLNLCRFLSPMLHLRSCNQKWGSVRGKNIFTFWFVVDSVQNVSVHTQHNCFTECLEVSILCLIDLCSSSLLENQWPSWWPATLSSICCMQFELYSESLCRLLSHSVLPACLHPNLRHCQNIRRQQISIMRRSPSEFVIFREHQI